MAKGGTLAGLLSAVEALDLNVEETDESTTQSKGTDEATLGVRTKRPVTCKPSSMVVAVSS